LNQSDPWQHVDTVLVKGLRLDASIGVFEWEKQIKQTLVFDLELFCDFTAALSSDAIEDAVDYAAVCQEIETLLTRKHYQLLENLAGEITRALLEKFSLQAIRLEIYKPGAVASTEHVGVRMFRCQTQHDKAKQPGTSPQQKSGC
jgi:dihydroneopterin aldolase